MKSNTNLCEVVVAGIGTTRYNVYDNREVYDLGREAILKALHDSNKTWNDMEAAFCGSVYQGTGSGHQVIKEVGLTGIPILNIENACSSGSSSFSIAYHAVASGQYDVVLVLGMEKMPRGPIPSTAFRPWELEMGFNFQPGNYALETLEYMEKYGVTEEDFSRVTIKNRRNGSLNPNARFQKVVSLDEVLNSRVIAKPLKLFHCCPIADGATAFILCSKKEGKVVSRRNSVFVSSTVLKTGVYGEDFYPSATIGSLLFPPEEGMVEQSSREAFEISGCGPEDIDLVQAYDTVAPAELWDIEKLGFCERGEAPKLLEKGYFDINGPLPVNTDGGLMSRGHPLGATACAQIYEIVLQLRGEAGARQINNPKVGLSHSMGAGPNSSVTVLKI